MRFFTILFLVLAATSLSIFSNSYAEEIEHGKNFDRILDGITDDGNYQYTWTSKPDRLNVGGQWINYKFTDIDSKIKIETANGAIVFDKTNCNLKMYDPGEIASAESPIVNSITSTLKSADVSGDLWADDPLNNQTCQITATQTEDMIKIIITKAQLLGSSFETQYDFSYDGIVKQTYRVQNNDLLSINNKYGFTQSFDGDFKITVGDQQYNTATLDHEVSFTKEDIEGKLIKIERNGIKILYDPQNYIHHYLWAFKIKPHHMNFDFTYAKETLGFGQTLTVDPTFGYASGTNYRAPTTAAGGTACPSTFAAKDTTWNIIVELFDTTGNNCSVSAPRWDISSIPQSPLGVTSVKVRYDVDLVLGMGSRTCQWRSVLNDPSSATVAQIYTDVLNGAGFGTETDCRTAANDKVITFNSNATSNLQTKRTGGQTWWAAGVSINPMIRDATSSYFRDNTGGHATELQVTYVTTGPTRPTSLTGTSSARQADFTWTISNGTGITTYYLGRSLDNSTWPAANKTSTGNVTSYHSYAYWRINQLYYINVTSSNGINSTSARFSSFTTDTFPSSPLNPYTTSISSSAIKLNWSPPSSAGGDTVNSYRIEGCLTCSSWTVLSNTTSTLNFNHTGLSGGQTWKYRMAAWNGVGLSAYTSNFTGKTWSPTTGTVSLTKGVVGDVVQLNTTVSITNAAPSPVTVSQLKLYRNGTLLSTTTTSVSIASGSSSSNFSPLWNQMTTGAHYSYKIYATVSNSTGTVQFGSANVTTNREYAPDYETASTASQGLVNYTSVRYNSYNNIDLKVNRDKGGNTFQIECLFQTPAQIIGTSSGGTWVNRTTTGYLNATVSGYRSTHVYITCYNDALLFTTISYTNSSIVQLGIAQFDAFFGGFLGVPVGVFFLLLVAGLATPKTANMYIVIILAVAAIMVQVGFFSIPAGVWALSLLGGAVGVLLKKLF